MMDSFSPQGYTYEADTHCEPCAEKRFGRDANGEVTGSDDEGNEVGAIFPGDFDSICNCGTCGKNFCTECGQTGIGQGEDCYNCGASNHYEDEEVTGSLEYDIPEHYSNISEGIFGASGATVERYEEDGAPAAHIKVGAVDSLYVFGNEEDRTYDFYAYGSVEEGLIEEQPGMTRGELERLFRTATDVIDEREVPLIDDVPALMSEIDSIVFAAKPIVRQRAVAKKVVPQSRDWKTWSEKDAWFDGTTASIYSHIVEGERILEGVSDLITAGVADLEDVTIEASIQEQLDTLRATAAQLDEDSLEDMLSQTPAGIYAKEYEDLVSAGLVDLGEDDGSPLYQAAVEVLGKAEAIDWDEWARTAPRVWVAEKAAHSPDVLSHEHDTRESAVDFAASKTLVVLDAARRAALIEQFVEGALRYRFQAHQVIGEDRAQELAQAQDETPTDVDIVMDDNGLLW